MMDERDIFIDLRQLAFEDEELSSVGFFQIKDSLVDSFLAEIEELIFYYFHLQLTD